MRFKSPPPLVSPRSCECKSTLDTSDGVFEGWTISTDSAEKAPLTMPCSDRDYCDLIIAVAPSDPTSAGPDPASW